MIAPKHTAKSVILDLERGLRDGNIELRRARAFEQFLATQFALELLRKELRRSVALEQLKTVSRVVYLRVGTNVVVWLVLVVAVALDFFNSSLDGIRRTLEMVAAALLAYN